MTIQPQPRRRGLFFGILFIGVLLVIVLLAGFLFLRGGLGGGAAPTVEILQPQSPFSIQSGQALVIQVRGQSPGGLARFELREDGIALQSGAVSGQDVTAGLAWFASAVGPREVSVVAYDAAGRASQPAVLQVNVAAASSSLAGLPLPAAGGGEGAGAAGAGGEDGDGAGDQAGGGQPDGGNGDPAGGQPDQEQEPAEPPAGGQPDQEQQPAEPPAGGDQPPTVELSAEIRREAGNVSILLAGSAQDDVALEVVQLVLAAPGGGLDLVLQDCLQLQECRFEHALQPGVQGEWLFIFHATDSSGQVSPPALRSVEVLGDPNGDPAFGVDDPLPAGFAENLPDLDLDAPQPMDPADFADAIRNAGEEDRQPGEIPEDALVLAVENRPDGNFLTLNVNADFQAAAGETIAVEVSKRHPANAGSVLGQNLFLFFPPGWYGAAQTALNPGDAFTFLDGDLLCGGGSAYRATAYTTSMSEAQLAAFRDASLYNSAVAESLAFSNEVRLGGAPCPAGSLGDIGLRAEYDPGGVTLRWDFDRGAAWPFADLPDGISYVLYRYAPSFPAGGGSYLFGERTTLHTGQAPLEGGAFADWRFFGGPNDRLVSGGWDEEFVFLDDEPLCAPELYYSLGVRPLEQNSLFGEWLLHATVSAPGLALEVHCRSELLDAVDLEIASQIVSGQLHVSAGFRVPGGLDWPERPLSLIVVQRITSADGSEQVFRSADRTTPSEHFLDVGFRGGAIDRAAKCGGYEYAYRMMLEQNGEILAYGPWSSIETPPC